MISKKLLYFIILVFINTLPCFSGGPYMFENGFYYMWSDADVYNEPDFFSDIIGKVHFNTRVEILGIRENFEHPDNNNNYDYWYKVDVNGYIGYIFGRYICSEKIEYIAWNGIKYIFLLHYSSSRCDIDDDTIKIIIDGNEISFASPTNKNLEKNKYFEYISIYGDKYYYEEWFFYENNVFTLISHNYVNHLLVFQYTLNNFGIESVRIHWYWATKGGEYDDSINLKWDNEKQIYYEIEETFEEQSWVKYRIMSMYSTYNEEDICGMEDIIEYIYEIINHDNENHSEISEIKNSGHFRKIEPLKTLFLDKVANKIMSNKKITYGVILFLLGIFIFVIINGKRKNKS
jgi:hypothetical protein